MGLGRVDYGKNKRGVGIQRVCEVKKVKVGGQDVIRWEYASDWMSAPHLVPQKWQEPLPY